QSRALLINETLRALAVSGVTPQQLPAESDRLDTPLFLYQAGELRAASDPLYADLAPIGRFLRPAVERALAVHDEETDTETEPVDGTTALFGYRVFNEPRLAATVIAAPAR